LTRVLLFIVISQDLLGAINIEMAASPTVSIFIEKPTRGTATTHLYQPPPYLMIPIMLTGWSEDMNILGLPFFLPVKKTPAGVPEKTLAIVFVKRITDG
jgi:hypothetical protein